MSISISLPRQVAVQYLKVEAEVRYWEDADVDGKADEDGSLIPCRNGNCWAPIIDLATGTVENWPAGITAEIHYKVCDAGRYTLLDANREVVKVIDGYVPPIMCPDESGYGDYIIMSIDGAGKIRGWRIDLAAFEHGDAA